MVKRWQFKIQYRVVLLLLALMGLAVVGLVILNKNENNRASVLYQEVVDERARLFSAVYRLDGESQANLATDYTYWDDLVKFVQKPDPKWANENLVTALNTYGVDVIWVYRPDGQLTYATNQSKAKLQLNLTPAQIRQLFLKSPATHFFIRTSSGFVEIRGATIVPSSDQTHATKPQGYFFAGRVYDLAYRQRLGGDLKSQVDLVSSRPAADPMPKTGQVVITKALTDQSNHPVGYLVSTSDAPAIRDLYVLGTRRIQTFIAIVLPVLLILVWFLTKYVAVPLGLISQTLKSHQAKDLGPLSSSRTEFGEIAGLIQSYFAENRHRLEEAHTRLRASINAINVGFVMTDLSGQVTMINDAARQILFNDIRRARETSLAELSGLLPSLHLERTVQNSIKTLTSHGLGESPYLEKFLRVFVAPITEAPGRGPALGSIILFQDVTLERSLKRARDEFFSIASHELRTPLTIIMGNADMIRDHIVPKANSPELAEMTTDIYDSSERLIQMVNDFLDMSRLEQNKINFELVSVDLVKLLDELVKEYQSVAKKQKISLKSELIGPAAGPVTARADIDKLRQVLINLIANAVTFTHTGGITLRLDPHPDYTRIYVIDTGEGIPPERHHLLFKKFQQAEANILSRNVSKSLIGSSARDTTHGTGLGLYISKLLVDGMGGLIRLESSEVGKGTTFSVTLPAAKASHLGKEE